MSRLPAEFCKWQIFRTAVELRIRNEEAHYSAVINSLSAECGGGHFGPPFRSFLNDSIYREGTRDRKNRKALCGICSEQLSSTCEGFPLDDKLEAAAGISRKMCFSRRARKVLPVRPSSLPSLPPSCHVAVSHKREAPSLLLAG